MLTGVLLRAGSGRRRDGLCRTVQSTVDCTGGITRYVWSGDNILWEMRGPGADSVPAARLNEGKRPDARAPGGTRDVSLVREDLLERGIRPGA